MAEAYIETFIRGKPFGQPRARARVVNGHADMYDAIKYPRDHATKPLQYMEWHLWKEKIKAHFRSQFPRRDPVDVAVRLDLDFHFPRDNEFLISPRSPKGKLWMKKKPDDDNLKKLVQDAMGKIWEIKPDEFVGIWTDDARICAGEVRKYYVAREPPTAPGVNIRVTLLEDDPQPDLFEDAQTTWRCGCLQWHPLDLARCPACLQWIDAEAAARGEAAEKLLKPPEIPQRPIRPLGRPQASAKPPLSPITSIVLPPRHPSPLTFPMASGTPST